MDELVISGAVQLLSVLPYDQLFLDKSTPADWYL
ncbi:hypothetical protein N836_12225 [Leptolyngbya sp. Heron Island J]|nr:hypothetical protein N836_12225 [Leptolyngbya sp. Heron Island J]